MQNGHEVSILIVEDDPGHARLIEKNLKRSNITNSVTVVADGQQALDFLFGEGTFAGHVPPAQLLVLLLQGVLGLAASGAGKGDEGALVALAAPRGEV